MTRIGLFLLSALGILLPGCERDDSKMGDKLDKMIEQNGEIIELLKSNPGARGQGAQAGQQRPQRPRPSPNDVYAVPIEGAAWAGAKDAKVTLVEAFEFA